MKLTAYIHRTPEQIAKAAIASLEKCAIEAGAAGHDALAAYLYKVHCGAFWAAPVGPTQTLAENPADLEMRGWVQSLRQSHPEAISSR